jgi:uncharacterized paraquat-inducible protein A
MNFSNKNHEHKINHRSFVSKKVILVLTISLGMSVFFTSCRDTKKENKTEMHKNHEHDTNETAMHDAYQCPMDCEDGKTYEKEGNCPVCKMDLKKVVHDNSEHKK